MNALAILIAGFLIAYSIELSADKLVAVLGA